MPPLMPPLTTVIATNTDEDKEEKNECVRDRLLTQNFNRFWCVKTTCSSSGIPEDVWNKLLKFGLIQNVRGDGNYGVYAAVEGLINCLIPVSTKVKTFRKRYVISLIRIEIRFYATSVSKGRNLKMER